MRRLACAVVLLLSGCVAPNSPEACRVVPVTDIPIKMRANLPIVEASIGGKPIRFLVDTGANIVQLTDAAVSRLGLNYDTRLSGYSSGLSARAPTRYTESVSIRIGEHDLKPLNISVVSKIGVLEAVPGVDGLLGLEALAVYDVDLDIPSRHIGLYEARNCPDGPPPFAGAVDTFKLPASPYRYAHVPVVVDGRGLALIADTGASATYLNQAQLGLSDADVANDRTILGRTSGPDSLNVHVHRFHSVRIGSIALEDVDLAVGPFQFDSGGLLGNDFWRYRRAWISFAGGAMTVQRIAGQFGQRRRGALERTDGAASP